MADTYIKYIDRSIASAFTDLYIVPDYQREYVWTDTQVEQLLSDLMEAYAADSKKAYFLGTIVTFDEGTRFELIDGQQRLTTFFILLCAIKHIYAQNNEKAGAIEKLIYSEVMNDYGDTVSQYHLQLQYEDAGNCLELIEKGENKPKNITQSGERLFNAYNIILNTMEDKFSDFAELKKFVVFLLNKTSFIRIETYDITDALKIFETVVLLSRKKVNDRINFDINIEALPDRVSKTATYAEIKAYVLEHYGLKVSSLYIAQIKEKHGIKERENYNIGEGKSKELICPPEKEEAITNALKHFNMI